MWLHNLVLLSAAWTFKHWGKIRFRLWVELEEIKQKIKESVGTNEFPDHLLSFLSTSLHIPIHWIEKAEWTNVVHAFYAVVLKFPELDLPIIRPSPLAGGGEPEPWEYSGRTWHVYSHLLAKAYGWDLEYISQLHPADALSKIQEILTDEQLEREFQHSLSKVAYPYNTQTKKNEFHPLQRPYWMRPPIKETKKILIPKGFLPIGEVNYESLPEELRPKEIVH